MFTTGHHHRHSMQSVKLYVKFFEQHVSVCFFFSPLYLSYPLHMWLFLLSLHIDIVSVVMCACVCLSFFCFSLKMTTFHSFSFLHILSFDFTMYVVVVFCFCAVATHFMSRRKVHDTSCSIFHHILYMDNYSDYIKQVHINAAFLALFTLISE